MMQFCLSYNSYTGGVSLRGVGDVYGEGDVVSDVKWNIFSHNGGYVFQHYNHSSRTMYPTGSGTAVGTPITTGSYSGSNSTFRWTMEDGGAPMGTLLHDNLTGTLANESTVRVVESGQTISLSRLNLTVSYYADWEYCFVPSWSSSNTSVASVNASTGQITAHAPGTATITLTIYSARYLTAADAGISNGTDVQQYFKFSDGDATTTSAEELSQMWKIKYLSSGYYSIRPMHKLNMGLDVTGSNTDIWSIGTSDALSSIPSYAQWTITFNTYGYLFENASAGKAMTTGVNAANGTTITVAETPSGTPSTQYRWLPERITSPPQWCVDL